MNAQQNTYSMPAEWTKHQRTLIAYPVRETVTYKQNYDETVSGYASVIRAVGEFEPVSVVVNSNDRQEAQNLCGTAVEFLEIPHSDGWIRDSGPIFVENTQGELAGVDFRFNAWGENYQGWEPDDALAAKILAHYGFPVIRSEFILEGGSVHTNGAGLFLTTAQCLLNFNRNPRKSKQEIEREVLDKLGGTGMVWLEKGLYQDETDGHVDNVACFVDEKTVLMQSCSDPNDPNFQPLQKNKEILTAAGLDVVTVEQPPARYYCCERMPLSYLNFYLVNGGVILPVFGKEAAKTDDAAKSTITSLFPDRKVIPVDGSKLIVEGGNVHCITQQMPVLGLGEVLA